MKFISFCNLFDSVITNTFKSRRFIFIYNSISLCSFSRLFKLQRIKKHSKTRNCRSEWLCVSFIKRHIDSRFFNKIIDHWVCVLFNDERYYRCIIDNQLLFVNLIIDSLFWSLERLSFSDLENNLFFEFIKFMINSLNNHFENLCRSESLVVISEISINVLKTINHLNL